MKSTVDSDHLIEELENALAAQKAQLHDLAVMGTVITSIHEIDAVLSVVMDMALRLVDGEVGVVLTDEDGPLKQKVTWGVGEDFLKALRYKDDLDLPTWVYRHREAVVLSDIGLTSDEGMLLHSLLALPIKTSSKCLGVMAILNKSGGGNFTDNDREAMEMLLNFVAVALDNSLLMKQQLRQQKMEQEMAIAREVQETILPRDIHRVAGVEIGAVYFPARAVGGDFYDVIPLDDNRFIVVIGDVSNKGVPAALIMSACSGIINTIVGSDPTITVSALAARLNDILAKVVIGEREMFVTLFFSIFDLAERRMTYCNAGHLPGLFWEQDEAAVTELAEGGPIVGQFPGITFKEGSRPISSGDRLFLFTDGLTEATDLAGNMFGRERVEQVFSVEIGLSPADFCLKVKDWVDRFQEGTGDDSHDDFTIVQVKVD
ncbi:SpoIIE family protein phosphatase [candidate division GN15 bacterium]|nr:SpoIIE family protein phosphatase [candidate division GN15 bacterium]